MGYLPIFLDMRGRDCLVIGGDKLAETRVGALLEAGVQITVVSQELTPALQAMARSGAIRHCARDYASSDMHGRFLVAIVTMDPTLAHAAAADARKFGALVNVADMPALCDFITPAVVRRGDVQIAISTGGASPALARRLRESIELLAGPEYEPLANLLRVARGWLRERTTSPDDRARILSAMVTSDLLGAFKRCDRDQVDKLVRTHLGAGLDAIGFTFDPDLPAAEDVVTPS